MSQPPVLQVDPASTPSREWAEATESALHTDAVDRSYVNQLDSTSTARPVAVTSTLTPAEAAAASVAPAVVEVQPVQTQSSTTTPGYELPGAFPKDQIVAALPSQEAVQETLRSAAQFISNAGSTAVSYLPPQEDVNKAISNATTTAAGYLPAQEDVTRTFAQTATALAGAGQTAATTAATYLPESITNVVSGSTNSTSLPSQEKFGAQPGEHLSSGVGALPGPLNESGVALLPAERTSLPSDYRESEGVQPGDKSDGVGPLPGKATEEGVVSNFEQTAAVPSQSSSLPSDSRESEGVHPGDKSDGVGPLPGKASEAGVVSGFERTAARTTATHGATDSSKSNGLPASGAAVASSRPGDYQPNNVGGATASQFLGDAAHREAHMNNSKDVKSAPAPPPKDGLHQPATLVTSPNHSYTPASQDLPLSNGSTDGTAKSTQDAVSPNGSEKKVGFMAKLKGEVKIVQGKLSGDHNKVDQGKSLKKGDA
ncbi:hypothetical protein SISSUDRAFT_1057410 [Sistotremastrum suecicum HHB10207 ss-3]|uniref:Uncharacterized protein n=1 Tax=Sistotremastrum suecicum HHB10207 ss-3 TaxID=1314776 RepID=A0A166IMF0_9AGAM|nr:hypothetical protein SISSUDRAFT_1057410 [Sistotremastrum suecicum HHB10207 ss-3]